MEQVAILQSKLHQAFCSLHQEALECRFLFVQTHVLIQVDCQPPMHYGMQTSEHYAWRKWVVFSSFVTVASKGKLLKHQLKSLIAFFTLTDLVFYLVFFWQQARRKQETVELMSRKSAPGKGLRELNSIYATYN